MKIAVVGATGRVGAALTRKLLSAGHQVKALSRGGPALDRLVEVGAEPFLGSFDTGAGELDKFFRDAEAAFLMVKTDWNNLHGHYPLIARRFVDALNESPVKLAVSLSAMGSEVKGDTGHFEGFHRLDETLNELKKIDLVHLRAAYFMEAMLFFTGGIARHGGIGWSVDPSVKLPWVATRDIADLAAEELTRPTGEHRGIRELGSEDRTMPEVAALVSREIGRPVDYRFVDRARKEVEAEFLARSGTRERWLYDTQTFDALNDGRVRLHEGDRRPQLPTKLEAFLRGTWKPRYLEALESQAPEDFQTWCARPSWT